MRITLLLALLCATVRTAEDGCGSGTACPTTGEPPLNHQVIIRPLLLAVLGLTVAAVIIGLQPTTAVLFGYARPVSNGLPSRFVLGGMTYTRLHGCIALDSRLLTHPCPLASAVVTCDPGCVSQAVLRRHHLWPLAPVGDLPTLFGASHPVRTLGNPNSGVGARYYVAFVVDGSCFVGYVGS